MIWHHLLLFRKVPGLSEFYVVLSTIQDSQLVSDAYDLKLEIHPYLGPFETHQGTSNQEQLHLISIWERLLKTNKGLINMKNEEQMRINYCFICDLYPWIAWNSLRILCSSLLIRFFIPLLIFLGGPWTHVVDFNCKKITPHIHESLCKGLLIRGGKIYLKWH